MTGKEWDNFELSDKKEYILTENKDFLMWYHMKLLKGYRFTLSIENMQDLINKIVAFYEFKYHDNMLKEIKYSCYFEDKIDFLNTKEIAKKLDISELKYRLHNDYRYLLEPSYNSMIKIIKETDNILLMNKSVYLHIEKDGTLWHYDVKRLKEKQIIDNIDGIKTINDLYKKLLNINDDNIDYSELEDLINNHKIKLELREKILNLIPLALIYSGGPDYGYIRAKSFIRMFNKEYGLNLDTTRIDEIASKDYSQSIIEESNISKTVPKRKIRERLNIFKKKN